MPWYSPIMTTAELVYRDYLIELEHEAQGWRAMAITHSVRGATIYPRGSTILTGPAQNDMIDAHSNAGRRWRGIDK